MAKNSNIGDGRALRVCDLCGGVDDHPRHVIAGTPGRQNITIAAPSDDILTKVMTAAPEAERGRLVRELMDTSSTDRHMDCCRDAGCPDGSCNTQTAGAEDLRGAALLDHLVSLTPQEG